MTVSSSSHPGGFSVLGCGEQGPPSRAVWRADECAGKPVSNKILLSISDRDYSSLRPHLEHVSLPNHLVIHEAGGKLEFAYFPNRGLISLVVVMKNGKTAEAGIVGNEAYRNTGRCRPEQSTLQAVIQITGDGSR